MEGSDGRKRKESGERKETEQKRQNAKKRTERNGAQCSAGNVDGRGNNARQYSGEVRRVDRGKFVRGAREVSTRGRQVSSREKGRQKEGERDDRKTEGGRPDVHGKDKTRLGNAAGHEE